MILLFFFSFSFLLLIAMPLGLVPNERDRKLAETFSLMFLIIFRI